MSPIAPLPPIKADLLLDLIEWAEVSDAFEKDPRFVGWGRWDQSNWGMAARKPDSEGGVCGTAYCIAGQAVAQNGYRLNYPKPESIEPGEEVGVTTAIPVVPAGIDDKGNVVWQDVEGGEPVDIETEARDILGITQWEGSNLFGGHNSIERLKDYVNLFFAARGMPLPYPDVHETYDPTTASGRREAHDFYLGSDNVTNFSWENEAAGVSV